MGNEIRLLSTARSVKSWPLLLAVGAFVAVTGLVSLLFQVFSAQGALALTALGLGLLGYPLVQAANTEYVVTNLRVAVISGAFAKSERHLPIAEVREVKVQRTGLQQTLGIGDVLLTGSGGTLVLAGVEEPEKVREKILSLR